VAEQDHFTTSTPSPEAPTRLQTPGTIQQELRLWWERWQHAVPPQILAVFWRQLSLLLEVGVPLLKALHQVADRTSHDAFRHVIQQVAADIEVGTSLSEALSRHPQIFSKLSVQVIEVAERGGVLDESLRLVAEELERHVEIRGKVRRALAYPITILLVGLLVMLFVLIYIIPEFVTIFADQNVALPLPTRILLGGIHILQSYWFIVLLMAAGLGYLFLLYIRTVDGRLQWDRFKLKLPLVGNLLVKASILRFAQTFGTLLRGGVPILMALKLVQEHAENSVLANELAQAYRSVDQGNRLEVSLRQSVVFPPLAVDIVAVGEEAGQLDTVLFKLAEMYKDEVDQSVSIFSSVLEPLSLLVMGIFVAIVVWAVYMPYFALPGLL
jgi:type IV pilus assembly protein PilC